MTYENDPLLQILDEREDIAFAELLGFSGVESDELIELIEYGVLEPRGGGQAEWRFPLRAVVQVRRAARLRTELELDIHALAVLLPLIERVEELERRLRELECHLLR